jgi:outer membrane protein OmpA-like peptidoglycan-associated protein
MRVTKFLLFICLLVPVSSAGESSPRIPLRVGLTIVTAISDRQGDYESIKRFESEDGTALRMKYSNEHPKPKDMFGDPNDNSPRPLVSVTSYRNILRKDLGDSTSYLQQFAPPPLVPETFPGATAVGVSATVLNNLKTQGRSQITIFQAPFVPTIPIKVDRQPGEMDFRESGTISRVEPNPVPVPVIVNGKLYNLPAIHAKGLLVGDQSEFYFLDDPQNPLALRYQIGKASLTVIKIDFPGDMQFSSSETSNAKQQASTSDASQMEQTLAKTGHVDVYGIYFSFNSDKIRDESQRVLKEIADILTKHPDWKLSVDGHTDNIGGSGASNLDLSNRRAAAVKKALVEQYHINPGRLATAGHGASMPKATNDTLEGRALNRRVELVRE